MTPEDLARDVIARRLDTQPSSRNLHLTDPTFHAGVCTLRLTLAAVARAMEDAGLYNVRYVLENVAVELVDDARLEREGDVVRGAMDAYPIRYHRWPL